MSKILVTGATGNIGSQTTKLLLERGASVRVGVRSPERAQWARDKGAEVVRLDLDDQASVRAALDGVQRALLVAPFVEGFDASVKMHIALAKEAGLEHVARISAFGANADAELNASRWHGASDKALAESGLAYTIVQPTFFMDNLINFSGETIRSQGALYGASAGKPVSYISSADIAAVAAKVLEQPSQYNEKTLALTGGEAITDEKIAALVSEATGKTVKYVEISSEQQAESLAAAGLPPWMVTALVGLERVKAQGWGAGVEPTVKQVLGRDPERYADFIARKVDALR
ncbi:MAG: SDR family oxidoreductase [Myxococcales bacterium]|nr:SDR family oxidoreductase [Myxococcales bacterium]